jgi:serpin B
MVMPVTAIHSVMTIALTAAGEKSSTNSEIAGAIGCPSGTNANTIAESYSSVLQSMRAEGDGAKTPIVRLANAVFVRPGFEITPKFAQMVKDQFDAEVSPATPNDLAKVNEIVKKTTDGHIDQVLKKLDPLMRVVLVSASYIKSGWSWPFKESWTRAEPFNPDGKTSSKTYNVNMMAITHDFGYSETANAQIVRLPLNGPVLDQEMHARYTAILFVPKGDATPTDILKMKQSDLDAALENVSYDNPVELSLPKFSVQSENDLVPALKSMGVKTPFNKADFSNMTTSTEELYISQVRSVGFLQIDEKGLAGGGAAAMEITAKGIFMPPPNQKVVVANRPFVMMVRDNLLNTPLLEAVVNRPDEAK